MESPQPPLKRRRRTARVMDRSEETPFTAELNTPMRDDADISAPPRAPRVARSKPTPGGDVARPAATKTAAASAAEPSTSLATAPESMGFVVLGALVLGFAAGALAGYLLRGDSQ